MEFPCMVYRPGDMFEWDGERFDYLICADEEELEIAQADGWVAHKPTAEEEVAATEIKVRKGKKAPEPEAGA